VTDFNELNEEHVIGGPSEHLCPWTILARCINALASILPYSLRYKVWKQQRRCLYFLGTMHEMTHEIHNLGHRIETLWKRRGRLPIGNTYGPIFGKDSKGCLVECTKTRGRIQDTQELLASPKATWLDVELFLEGWDRGVEWEFSHPHACIAGSCKRLSGASIFPDYTKHR
jgi:hypothetical protein